MVEEIYKIYILESVREGELKTGLRLFEDTIQPITINSNHITVRHKTIFNKKEFFSYLMLISNEVKSNSIHSIRLYPILHIECHGEESGITLNNNDEISWKELYYYLAAINMACGLQLVVVLAACRGQYLADVVMKAYSQKNGEPVAPFYFMIAPKGIISAGIIEKAFKGFYREFFINDDLIAAKKSLNEHVGNNDDMKFLIYAVEEIFAKSYASYIYNYCQGKRRRQRLEDLLSTVRSMLKSTSIPIGKHRRFFRSGLTEEATKKRFIEHKEIFFMENLFPINKERFKVTYDKIMDYVRLF